MIYEDNLPHAIFSIGPFNLGGHQIGPLEPRWYALMYILGFVCLYFIVSKHPRFRELGKTKDDAMDFLTYGFVGVLAGGRLGYILFYNLQWYLAHPGDIIKIWTGGMSFHGGLIGSIVAILLYARNRKIPTLTMLDIVALPTPLGLGFGRIGNFINGELWGKPTNGTWGVKFQEPVPGSTQTVLGPPRHPTQLYEAFLEGVILFSLLWFMTYKSKLKPGSIGGLFLAGYGCARFLVEFCRLPDAQIGYLYGGWLTMGHVLSLPMIIGGLIMVAWANRSGAPSYEALAAKSLSAAPAATAAKAQASGATQAEASAQAEQSAEQAAADSEEASPKAEDRS